MKFVVAIVICAATLVAVDRAFFNGSYVAALQDSASNSAAHFRQ